MECERHSAACTTPLIWLQMGVIEHCGIDLREPQSNESIFHTPSGGLDENRTDQPWNSNKASLSCTCRKGDQSRNEVFIVCGFSTSMQSIYNLRAPEFQSTQAAEFAITRVSDSATMNWCENCESVSDLLTEYSEEKLLNRTRNYSRGPKRIYSLVFLFDT